MFLQYIVLDDWAYSGASPDQVRFNDYVSLQCPAKLSASLENTFSNYLIITMSPLGVELELFSFRF